MTPPSIAGAAVTLLAFFSIQAMAQNATDRCLKMDDKPRLECYDFELHRAGPGTSSVAQPTPDIAAASAATVAAKPTAWSLADTKFKIRQSGDYTTFGEEDFVDKPGLLTVQRSDGQNSTTAKLAVIAAFPAIGSLGWQPFASSSWNRDTSGSKPKDIRDLNIGVMGSLWDVLPSGWTLFPTLRATHRSDRFDTSDSNGLALNVNVVVLNWVSSPIYVVPQFGYLAEKRNGGGTDEGTWRSAYVGVDAAAKLDGFVPRLALSVGYQRFVDEAVPSGSSKRRV